MNFQEFTEEVLNIMNEKLDDNQYASIQCVRKNNDVLLHGLTIHSGRYNVTPTIYLETFYVLYQKGTSLDEIVEKIRQIYQENLPKGDISMDFFGDFEKVKDRIVYRLIHAERNKELLKDIPYIPFWDLAICFAYSFQSEELGDGMILIHNSHMEYWHVNYKLLMKHAEENTPILQPMSFCSMNTLLKQMQIEADGYWEPEELLYILTNEQKTYGASVLLYPAVLQWVAEQLQSDYYIIPSSVHEVLIMKADPIKDIQEEGKFLHGMICEINVGQLNAEEVLSDFPYYYNRNDKKLMQIL